MGKSNRLRLRDLSDAFRLIGECRDLGGGVRDWRERMLLGLSQLVDAQIAMAAEVRGDGPSWREALHVPVDVGWDSAADRAVLMNYEVEQRLSDDLTFAPLVGLARPLVTRRREQVIADDAWYSSTAFNEHRRRGGVDDWIHSLHTLADPQAMHIITLHRPPGGPRFTERERRLVHIFHHELARLMGEILLREPDRILSGLSPRLRQVLDCLLEGDSEKQVAARLGLSRPTVHEYVTVLYRRFDVSSRGGTPRPLLSPPSTVRLSLSTARAPVGSTSALKPGTVDPDKENTQLQPLSFHAYVAANVYAVADQQIARWMAPYLGSPDPGPAPPRSPQEAPIEPQEERSILRGLFDR